MDVEGSGTTLDIEQYLHVVKRQWRLILALTVAGLLISVGYFAQVPRQYTATTTVNLTVISTEPFAGRSTPSSLLDEQEERAIAHSHAVAEKASELMGGEMTGAEIRDASSVSAAAGAAVVSIYFTAETPEQAKGGADAVAEAFLAYRSERAADRIAVLVDGLETRISGIEGQVRDIDVALSTLASGSPEAARSTTERQSLLAEHEGLVGERNKLQSVDTTAGFVLSSASDNLLDAAPSVKLVLLTGLASGFVVGILAAFLRNPRDRRLRNASEVARALHAPVLARVDGDIDRVPARGDEVDGLRVARERILAQSDPGDVVAVIDASHSSSISSAALNLSVVTAQAGQSVQLVAPEDPRRVRARLGGVLEGVKGEAGAGGADGVLRVVDITDLGDDAQRDLLVTQQVALAIEGAGRSTLTYLVMTLNARPSSLLAALRKADVAVLVARESVTTTTEVDWLKREAAGLGVTIRGAIIESAPRRRRRARRQDSVPAERQESAPRTGATTESRRKTRDGAPARV